MKSLRAAIILVSAVAACVLVVSPRQAAAQQQPFKVGIVNFDEIISKLPEFKDIESKLQTLQSAYQDTLKQIQNEYQGLVDNYQKQQALMSAENRTAEENKIAGVRDRFLRFQQERLGQGGTLFQYQAQLMQPVRDKVRGAIEKIAKSEKISLVIESGITVYFDEKMDITFKVLDYLKRGS